MRIVEPILALAALDHELVLVCSILLRCLLTVAVNVEKGVIIDIFCIFVVSWWC